MRSKNGVEKRILNLGETTYKKERFFSRGILHVVVKGRYCLKRKEQAFERKETSSSLGPDLFQSKTFKHGNGGRTSREISLLKECVVAAVSVA